MLHAAPAEEALTVNGLIDRTHGRGLYLVVILFALLFIVPISIPGVSTVLGLAVAILSFRLALGLAPRLPRFFGDRPLPAGVRQKILSGGAKFLRFIEKLVRPRRTRWLGTPAARVVNGLVLGFLGCLLALPFPPLPPLTNSLPSYAIILIAASAMEEDGALIWVGYTVALGAVVYLTFIAAALQQAVIKVYDWFRGLF
jgi:hypothetical protein